MTRNLKKRNNIKLKLTFKNSVFIQLYKEKIIDWSSVEIFLQVLSGNKSIITTHEKHLAKSCPLVCPSPEFVMTTSCADY